jgi:hypothetical protein
MMNLRDLPEQQPLHQASGMPLLTKTQQNILKQYSTKTLLQSSNFI